MYLQYMKNVNFIIKFMLYYKLFLWCDAQKNKWKISNEEKNKEKNIKL